MIVARRPSLDVATLAAGCSLLFVILFIPTAYTRFVAVILGITLLLVVARWVRDRRIALDGTVAALTIFFVVVGAAFTGYGLLRHNPGATSEAGVFVLWPVLYLILITGLDDKAGFEWINRVFLLATIAIGLYTVDFVLVNLHLLPQRAFIDFQQDARFGLFKGRNYLQLNLNSFASMMFLSPYALARLAGLRSTAGRLEKAAVVLAVVLAVTITVLALRRALLIDTFLLAPALIAIYALWFRRGDWKWQIVAVVAVGLATFVVIALATASGHFHPKDYVNALVQGVDFSGSQAAGPKARTDQFSALTHAWLRSPVIGYGLGGVASVIRSTSQPWAYELSYNALLFKTGLVGFVLYAAGVAWLLWQAFMIVRDESDHSPVGPILVGVAGFLFANATNPYLEKFDYLWVIFIPLAYVNFSRLQTGRSVTRWDRQLSSLLARLGMRQGLRETRPLGGGE